MLETLCHQNPGSRVETATQHHEHRFLIFSNQNAAQNQVERKRVFPNFEEPAGECVDEDKGVFASEIDPVVNSVARVDLADVEICIFFDGLFCLTVVDLYFMVAGA